MCTTSRPYTEVEEVEKELELALELNLHGDWSFENLLPLGVNSGGQRGGRPLGDGKG